MPYHASYSTGKEAEAAASAACVAFVRILKSERRLVASEVSKSVFVPSEGGNKTIRDEEGDLGNCAISMISSSSQFPNDRRRSSGAGEIVMKLSTISLNLTDSPSTNINKGELRVAR